ncbi:hypothetical protein [Streptomyces sp. NPDC048845]|uniref:hypothetical protein n=1 Tax=Streptomyces sp. NPDC048845 TaxID=3155390 RepID=UPI00342CD5E0
MRDQLRREEAKYEAGLRERERHIRTLRDPRPGDRLGSLGELVLHEHVLLVDSPTEKRRVDLIGLQVRFEAGQRNHSIYLTQSDGRVHRAKYSRHLPVEDGGVQHFDEDRVRDFAVDIQNAVAGDNAFHASNAQQLAHAEKGLDDFREDTASVDKARAQLSQIRDGNNRDPRRSQAEAELEEALQRWETLTGRRPPR